MLNHIKNLLRGQISLKDVWYFIQGNIRYFLYNYYRYLLRKHIVEQYEYRKKVADKQCIDEFACKECGCETPQLFLANKECEGDCYGPMRNKKDWNNLKQG